MASASEIAREFEKRFLIQGNVVFAGAFRSGAWDPLALPATASRITGDVDKFVEEGGFSW